MSIDATRRPLLSSLARHTPLAVRRGLAGGGMLHVGLGLIVLVVLASAIGPLFLPDPNEQDLAAPLRSPSFEHPFGTDELGRDVLSRTLAGTWVDLPIAIGVTLLAVGIGLIVGTVAGYVGGWLEKGTMRLADATLALPQLVLVLGIIAVVGPGLKGLVVGVSAAAWAVYARLARGEMLVLRDKQFIKAATSLGYSHRRVVLRHSLPNLLRPIVVFAMSDVVFCILAISSLSFLGLGVAPPTPEWGAIINSGQQYLEEAWWISTLPGVVVVIVGVGFVLVGDGLADRLGVRREGTNS